jgi:hypothetical protein
MVGRDVFEYVIGYSIRQGVDALGRGKKAMRHVSIVIHPREAGLKPYHVSFYRPESAPVRSVLDDGMSLVTQNTLMRPLYGLRTNTI